MTLFSKYLLKTWFSWWYFLSLRGSDREGAYSPGWQMNGPINMKRQGTFVCYTISHPYRVVLFPCHQNDFL